MKKVEYGERGSGLPLILLHGFCETREIWDSFSGYLGEEFKILTPDLPGFGGSQPIEDDFTLGDVADAMVEWVRPWKESSPVLIGHSLGGYVALEMARKEPGIFGGIGLFHSTVYADTEEKKESRNKVISFVERHGVAAYTETFVPGLFLDKKHPAIPKVQKIASATSAGSLRRYAAAMRDRSPSVRFLEKFDKPVLFIGGEKDSIIPINQIREQAGIARHPVLYSLATAAHMGMLECPSETGKMVADFARRVAKPVG